MPKGDVLVRGEFCAAARCAPKPNRLGLFCCADVIPAFGEIPWGDRRCVIFPIGNGTSRGSCGLTGIWNMAGQALKSSKIGTVARPLRNALSRIASGSTIGCKGDRLEFLDTSIGSPGRRSPTVSPELGFVPAGAKGLKGAA